jgi:hypothetical protein
METLSDKKVAKGCTTNYHCNICDYNTCRKSSYDKHLLTAKHQKLLQGDKKVAKCFNINETTFICKKCNKQYTSRNGLWKHNKVCNEVSEKELIMMLLKQNSELIMKMGTANTTNNTNNTNTISHNNNNNNKTFNLQFFLNEECKNALNIGEFVSSIKMDLDDLEKTGLLGYAEGISNIINKNLNDLDQTMRPIHCSDVKREVFYVKNDDQWIKENDSKPVLTKAIKQIAHENIKQISEWQKKYPDCCDPESQKNDAYLNIVSNAMSGLTNEEQIKNYEKIIKNVAKEVTIDKV